MSKSNSGENRCPDCGLFVGSDTPCARCNGEITYETSPRDGSGRPGVTDEQVIDSLSEAISDGRSLDGGGSTPKQVADYSELSVATLDERLRRLAREGRIEQTWGFGERPKMTYEPAEDIDDE